MLQRRKLAHLTLYALMVGCGDPAFEHADSATDAAERLTTQYDAAADAALQDASVDAGHICPPGCRFEMRGYCSEWEPSSVHHFAATLEEWTFSRCPEQDGGTSGAVPSPFPFFVEGNCSGGGRVLYWGTGLAVERRFFTSDGTFEALQTGTDATPPECRGDWPTSITCGTATVSRVICGSALSVGQVIRYH